MGTFHPKHHKRIVFLLELQLQCMLSEQIFIKLKNSAIAAIKNSEFEGQSGAPVEIMHLVHSFLTYAGVISKIIFHKNRKDQIKERCLDIQSLLKIASSKNLENLNVRNSFEHIDERLDTYLPEPPYKITPFAIGGSECTAKEIVLKRFDPHQLEFWLLNHSVKLDQLFEEIKLIESSINTAFDKFSNKEE